VKRFAVSDAPMRPKPRRIGHNFCTLHDVLGAESQRRTRGGPTRIIRAAARIKLIMCNVAVRRARPQLNSQRYHRNSQIIARVRLRDGFIQPERLFNNDLDRMPESRRCMLSRFRLTRILLLTVIASFAATSSFAANPDHGETPGQALVRGMSSNPTREVPRLCRGGSKSLTFPEVAHR
jgi:hypothetical protein